MNTAVITDVDALRARLDTVLADRERMADALEHIANVCDGSRTSTRRLRWLALRARCAVRGDDKSWRDADLPVVDPLVDKLRELLRMIFPIPAAELKQLVSSYTAPAHQERLANDLPALIETIDERAVHADCLVLREFLQQTRRNVPEINIDELRKGGDWIELT